MPIHDYDGDTFIAFLDICGFKELMRNPKKAWKALDRFYQYGYDVLRDQNHGYKVEGIFVSDCGILFVRGQGQITVQTSESLKSLLSMIKKINEGMSESDIMLTTSIAYGKFKYQKRIEFEGIEKNPIYGNAYISAFLDNESGKPRIQPGQCRIMKENLPEDVSSAIRQEQRNEIYNMISQRDGDAKHHYYYWMVNHTDAIVRFEQDYKDAYNLKYTGMLKAIKDCKTWPSSGN
jgi:hypothetical protein